MPVTALKRDLEVLFSVYAYAHASRLLASHELSLSEDFHTLLHIMTNRTKLHIEPLFEEDRQAYFERKYQFSLADNAYDDELLANYIMVLESQLKIGDRIDFVRAVSPVIYRLFLRLAKQLIPDLMAYFHNARDDRYDTWQLKAMSESNSPTLIAFSKGTGDARVTSKSLQDLLLLCDLPDDIKQIVKDLRRFEKSVRNPLAHLIKAFDEEELYRTTQFSSQDFLNKIIALAQYTGVVYDKETFYFDKANVLLSTLLHD